jgi:hypothetical protein
MVSDETTPTVLYPFITPVAKHVVSAKKPLINTFY